MSFRHRSCARRLNYTICHENCHAVLRANDQFPKGMAYVAGRKLANLCGIRRDSKSLACLGDGGNPLPRSEACLLDRFRLSIKKHFEESALQKPCQIAA